MIDTPVHHYVNYLNLRRQTDFPSLGGLFTERQLLGQVDSRIILCRVVHKTHKGVKTEREGKGEWLKRWNEANGDTWNLCLLNKVTVALVYSTYIISFWKGEKGENWESISERAFEASITVSQSVSQSHKFPRRGFEIGLIWEDQ